MVQFGDLERYMEEEKDAKVCLQILSEPQEHMLLQIELPGTIDAGKHFVKANQTRCCSMLYKGNASSIFFRNVSTS